MAREFIGYGFSEKSDLYLYGGLVALMKRAS
jgi:hypothetical protein